jgi:hypothetical protein
LPVSVSPRTQTGLPYTTSDILQIFETSNPDYWVQGQVTSYNSGTGALVVNVLGASGPNSAFTDWTIGEVAVNTNVGDDEDNSNFQIANVQFSADDASATAFYTDDAIGASFTNCAFSGHIGLNLQSGFTVSVRSCTL